MELSSSLLLFLYAAGIATGMVAVYCQWHPATGCCQHSGLRSCSQSLYSGLPCCVCTCTVPEANLPAVHAAGVDPGSIGQLTHTVSSVAAFQCSGRVWRERVRTAPRLS